MMLCLAAAGSPHMIHHKVGARSVLESLLKNENISLFRSLISNKRFYTMNSNVLHLVKDKRRNDQ